jgi:hypothetical protein
MTLDLIFYIYIFGALVSCYGFGLFLWWWKTVGVATDIYALIAFLFLTNGFSDSISVYSRYLKLYGNPNEMLEFHSCDIWLYRRVPEIIVLTIIMVKMTLRVITTKNKIKNGEAILAKNAIKK